MYNINWIKCLFGSEMCTQMLFLHAFTGCDSMYSVYGVGMKPALEKLAKCDPVFQCCTNTFTLHCKNHSDIEHLGSQAMSVTFGGESTCSLAAVCYGIFTKKVTSAKSFLLPEHLTPTDSASKFHRLRVYYQTMT